MYQVDFGALPKETTPHGYRNVLSGEFLSIQYSHNEAGRSLLGGHAHEYEQLIVCLKGEYQLFVGEEELHLKTGDVVLIPGNVWHRGVSISEDSVTFSVFAPARAEDRR